MKNSLAIFRADASSYIGGGHVMRCLTLADALSEAGWQCRFSCTAETVETMPLLRDCGYDIISPDKLGDSAALLVVDHYGLNREFEVESRPWAKNVLVVDDLADRSHDCDFLLDQTFGRAESDYKDLVPGHCEVMTGSGYALLRPQFQKARVEALQNRERRAGKVENILVMLGAGDKENVTGFILDAIEALDISFHVDVIMGGNAPHLASVEAQADKSHHDMTVYSGVADVASFMVKADLAIGAGGTASWERCCLGLPTLVVELADNQHKIIQELEVKGAVLNIGWHKDLSLQDVSKNIAYLHGNQGGVMGMYEAAKDICDGEGASRIETILGKVM